MSLVELLTTHRHLKWDKGDPNWTLFFCWESQAKNATNRWFNLQQFIVDLNSNNISL